MIDREKVINKVKAIVADMQEEVDEWKDYSDSELRGGLTCDCDWWYKTLQTLKDALVLLKAQEPRVMTLEDVLKLRFNDVVYFEMTVSSVAIPAIVIDVIEHMPDGEIGLLQLRHIQQPTNNADLEYYGKTWRCWTSRPTDEQREKEPWDDAER